MTRYVWAVVEVLGFVAIVAGVAMWSAAAALVIGGTLGLGASWLVNHR